MKQLILRLPFVRNRKNRKIVKWWIARLRRALRFSALPLGPEAAREYAVPESESFVGYYDISPLSRDQKKLLTHVVHGGSRRLQSGDVAHLGYFDLETGDFHEFAETTSWCWQMGSRLRWHPNNDNSQVLFNTRLEEHHCTVVYDLPLRTVVKSYPFAFIDVAKTAEFAVALNFSRLGRLRPGYGYVDLPDTSMQENAPNDDGLWHVRLDSGEASLLVSYEELSNFCPKYDMSTSQHYVNLVMISPSGMSIAFLHLWVRPDGVSNVRLLEIDRSGKGLKVLADDAKPSHGWWLDDQRFLVTMVFPTGRTEYRLIENGVSCGLFHKNLPALDGHPSLSPDSGYLLTDSYPDKFGEQNLEILCLEDGQLKRIGKYLSAFSYIDDELRCDLHPRWSPDGKSIIFDSTHNGHRAVYVSNHARL